MAKFCKYCGKELKKGEVCSCKTQKEKVENSKNTEYEKAKETIKLEVSTTSKRYFQKMGSLIKSIFQNSSQTMHDYLKEKDYHLTYLLIFLSGAVLAFCTVSFLKGIYTTLSQVTSGYRFYTATQNINQFWNLSYFKVFCCVFIGVILGYGLLAIILDLGFEKISKTKITFHDALSAIAISLLEPTIMCVIGAFFTIFSYKLALIFIFYALFLFLINLYQAFQIAGDVLSKHYNRLFVILLLIFIFLAIYLIPNLFL